MISESAKYWIWIVSALGYDNVKVKRLYELYPEIAVFYEGGESEWRYCGIFGARELGKLSSTALSDSQAIIDRCRQLNYSIICIDDDKFPSCLRNIEDPPGLIYVHGNLPDVDNRLTIGIVGTRRATKYGTENSYKIAYALAKYGVTVISGGALGVDCASHRGALGANGVTVCVRGCGINSSYLRDNMQMRNAITSKGAVISEYPPDETARNFYFPQRNRIISALSDGLLVIEAGSKSGSLITANLALEQGKDVFALLGNNSPQNEGSNNRIKEGTAVPVTDFMDILNYYDNLYATSGDVDFDDISAEEIDAIPVKGQPNMPAKREGRARRVKFTEVRFETVKPQKKDKRNDEAKKPDEKALNLSTTARSVYEYITDEPVHIDKISADLQIPVYKVSAAITELEMKQLITAHQGRLYTLKRR